MPPVSTKLASVVVNRNFKANVIPERVLPAFQVDLFVAHGAALRQ